MDQATCQPYVLYQSVDISFNFEEESIYGHTTIWLGFRETITPGTVLNLHCRQCNIKEVLMNGAPCDYVHTDPLTNLAFDDRTAESYIGKALDSTYRAALEISRAGELSVRILYDLPMKLALPQPLPKGAPADVQSRYNKLMKIYDKLGPNGDPTDNDLEQQMLNAGDHGKVLQLTIIYSLCKGGENAFTSGFVFRSSPFQAKAGSGSSGGSHRSRRKQSANVDTTTTTATNLSGSEHSRGDMIASDNDTVITNATSSVSKSHSSAYASVCAYTNYGGTGTLRDLDGVRCWLPCIDSLEQRAVYDITIHAPGDMHALSCGKNISVTPTTYKVFKRLLAARKQQQQQGSSSGSSSTHTRRHPSSTSTAAAATATTPATTAEDHGDKKKEYSSKDAWLSLVGHCYGRDDYASYDFLSSSSSSSFENNSNSNSSYSSDGSKARGGGGRVRGPSSSSSSSSPPGKSTATPANNNNLNLSLSGFFDDRAAVDDDAVVLSTRFFTTNRIPAMALGFFVGRVEGYKMNLYKTLGRYWVALDLMDHYSSSSSSSGAHDDDGNASGTKNTSNISKGGGGGGEGGRKAASLGGLVGTFKNIKLEKNVASSPPAVSTGISGDDSHHHNSTASSSSSSKRIKLEEDGSYTGIVESKEESSSSSHDCRSSLDHSAAVDDLHLHRKTTSSAATTVTAAAAAAGAGSSSPAGAASEEQKAMTTEEEEVINGKEGEEERGEGSSPLPPLIEEEDDEEEVAERLAKKFVTDMQLELVHRLQTTQHSRAKVKAKANAESRRLLYDETVMHTTLGLELALKHIHKFVGHFFDHDVYTQVFVHGLDEQFCAFDGFALVDADLLHTNENISMETPAHIAQITAYLYAWMKAALPVDSYEAEFIIHGTVGYLVNFYVEHVYGEDEGKFRYQKLRDTVIELEKAGKGLPLASLFPENYEEFSPYFRQYLTSKSTVLFHMIENTIGGKDPMRLALKQIVKSPALYTTAPPVKHHHQQQHHPGGVAGGGTGTGISSSSTSSTTAAAATATVGAVDSASFQPYTGGAMAYGAMGLYPPPTPSTGSEPPTPYPYADPLVLSATSPRTVQSPYVPAGPQSPYIGMPQSPYTGMPQSPYTGMPQSPYTGMPQSPYIGMPQSPYPGIPQSPYFPSSGAMSPHVSVHGTPRSSDPDYQEFHEEFMSPRRRGNSFSIPSPVIPTNISTVGSLSGPGPSPVYILRQDSVTSETGWERDLNSLVCDCLSATTFISLVRSSSGASADLSESFVEKYVMGSGVMFVRMGLTVDPKVENKARTISVLVEQVARKGANGKAIKDLRDELKLRIVEFRDNLTREPTITVAAKKDVYTQQMHTRPGRKGGRKKGSGKLGGKEQEGMSADQLAELSRAEKERDANKDAVQMSRDLEHPVRYVLLDPYCTSLCHVHNFSTDCLLVEQLYTEIDEFDLLRHIHALRSLACISQASSAASSSMALFSEVSSQAAVSDGARSDIIQLRALSDCLLGNPPSQSLSYERNSSGAAGTVLMTSPHSLYIRVEATFAIAQWQNERAPKQASADASWPGLAVLLTALKDMFIDTDTSLPLPNDFTDEASTVLRTSLLLALSTIRANNGVTPLAVTKTLLLFAQHNAIQAAANSQSGGGEASSSANAGDGSTDAQTSRKPTGGSGPIYDDSHYKAALLLALSRVKMEHHHCYGHFSTKGYKVDSAGYLLTKIMNVAQSFLQSELVFARGTARMKHTPGDANLLPKLPMGGLVVAAALTCLAEVDIQATLIGLTPASLPTATPGPVTPGVGEFTGVDYSQYFLQQGMVLAYQQKQQQQQAAAMLAAAASSSGTHTPHDHHSSTHTSTHATVAAVAAAAARESKRYHKLHEKWEDSFSKEARKSAASAWAERSASSSASAAAAYSLAALCSPVVRESALEAFVHLCLMQYRATYSRIKRNQTVSGQPIDPKAILKYTSDLTTGPLDAVVTVIKHDPSRRTRRQAATTFLHALQDSPLRCAFAAFSLGEPRLCLGWSDTDALTLPYTAGLSSAVASARAGASQLSAHPLCGKRSNASVILDAVTETTGKSIRTSWIEIWRIIGEHSSNDQVVRSVLLTTWMYSNGLKPPRALSKSDRSNVQAPEDHFFDHDTIPREQLNIKTPLENAFPVEQALRFGNDFKPPVAPVGATAIISGASKQGGGGGGGVSGAGSGNFVLSLKRQKSEASIPAVGGGSSSAVGVVVGGGVGSVSIASPPPAAPPAFKITLK